MEGIHKNLICTNIMCFSVLSFLDSICACEQFQYIHVYVFFFPLISDLIVNRSHGMYGLVYFMENFLTNWVDLLIRSCTVHIYIFMLEWEN